MWLMLIFFIVQLMVFISFLRLVLGFFFRMLQRVLVYLLKCCFGQMVMIGLFGISVQFRFFRGGRLKCVCRVLSLFRVGLFSGCRQVGKLIIWIMLLLFLISCILWLLRLCLMFIRVCGVECEVMMGVWLRVVICFRVLVDICEMLMIILRLLSCLIVCLFSGERLFRVFVVLLKNGKGWEELD